MPGEMGPAGKDQDKQGGLSQAKLIDRHQMMIDDGWVRIGNGKYEKKEFMAENYSVPPAQGMVRRITRAANSRKVLEDLQLSQSLVQSKLGIAGPKDCRINRSMKTPMDDEIEIELIPISAVDDIENTLEAALPPKEASLYRAIIARVNFLAADRAELQFASKECSRRMSNPRLMDWGSIKRTGRFLDGQTPRGPMVLLARRTQPFLRIFGFQLGWLQRD